MTHNGDFNETGHETFHSHKKNKNQIKSFNDISKRYKLSVHLKYFYGALPSLTLSCLVNTKILVVKKIMYCILYFFSIKKKSFYSLLFNYL